MFDSMKPLPKPYVEVDRLWREFIAKASEHLQVDRFEWTCSFEGKLELRAVMRKKGTEDGG